MRTIFRPHHCTLSVRDTEKSAGFYAIFGFKLAFRWTAEDASLVITHLTRDDGFILELFEYGSNRGLAPDRPQVGNDLERPGVKHIAFNVADLPVAAAELQKMDCGEMTEIQLGRTGIEYFFIADPDGNWVEVVQDDRSLDSGNPVFKHGMTLDT